MPKTVDDAFTMFLGWLTPSETESAKAVSHRASIEACLKSNFAMTNFFRAGSFGHGTSVSGISDVDYFAVIPLANLKEDSSSTLRQVKEALKLRFPSTEIYVDSPAVAVQFGSQKWERHEITPVEFLSKTKGFNVYDIPNRYGGWMNSSPTGLNSYVNEQNDRLAKKGKQLIRLVKAWNYYANAQIRSIYIELRVTEYLSGEAAVLYPIDVGRALRHMQKKGLASMQDPLGLGAPIYPCSEALKPAALSKLDTAITRAEKAEASRYAGRENDAIEWWDKLYCGQFPGFY